MKVITICKFNEKPRYITVLGDKADNSTVMAEMMELPMSIQLGEMSDNGEDIVYDGPQDIILQLSPSDVVAIFTGSQLDPENSFGSFVILELAKLMEG